MRYSASEKIEIIRPVEQSHLSAKQTLDKPGIPESTFYTWYDRHQTGGGCLCGSSRLGAHWLEDLLACLE
ncbi:hypothetical protein K1W69_24245 [Hoeflea sp. WL0058]|uniref:Transposase n=1 Tax=Flavimaribacter sediminis TaxID=2865987 RepID=A0AAE3D246_9HYPH|nr:hypothetical protein [Flavimaribacter sediminis]